MKLSILSPDRRPTAAAQLLTTKKVAAQKFSSPPVKKSEGFYKGSKVPLMSQVKDSKMLSK